MSKTEQQIHGRIGEDAVAANYEANGYRVIARNYRSSHMEIDLIVENDHSIVFIEVKARVQAYGVRTRYGRPADAVNAGKRRRTVLAAEAYLREHPVNKQPRIDVAEVYLTPAADPHDPPTVERVLTFYNAFGAK